MSASCGCVRLGEKGAGRKLKSARLTTEEERVGEDQETPRTKTKRRRWEGMDMPRPEVPGPCWLALPACPVLTSPLAAPDAAAADGGDDDDDDDDGEDRGAVAALWL
jgi:hypothetical protein